MKLLSKPRIVPVPRPYGNERTRAGEPLPPVPSFEDACIVCEQCGAQARYTGPVAGIVQYLATLGWRQEGAFFVCGPLCSSAVRGDYVDERM